MSDNFDDGVGALRFFPIFLHTRSQSLPSFCRGPPHSVIQPRRLFFEASLMRRGAGDSVIRRKEKIKGYKDIRI